MTVRGAAFLGIGAMVGAGIFALLGEAGAVAGAAVWLSFLLAGIVAGLLGYTVVKLGVRFPSSGGLIAYLIGGVRERAARGSRVVAGLLRRDRDRLLDGGGRLRQLRVLAVHRRRRRERAGTTSSPRRSCSGCWDQRGRLARRRSGPVADRRRPARGLRRLHRRDDRRHRLRPAGVRRLSVAVGHHRERRADVLRLPGLQRDHVRRGGPARPRPRAPEGDVPRAGRDERHLRADLAGSIRDAHGRRGDRLRRDGDRGGRAAHAGGGGLRDDGHRRPAGDRLLGQRDALCLGRADRDARRSGSSRRSSGAARRSALTPGC